jgi:hypothetical protein
MPPTFLLADMSAKDLLARFAYSAQPQAPVASPRHRRRLRRLLARTRTT